MIIIKWYLELSKKVDYLVCSKNFAEEYTGIQINFTYTPSIKDAYDILKADFKNNVVITLEDKGCVYEHDGILKIMPSLRVRAVDSTAAGDIFHGAFAYGLAQGFDMEKIVRIANIAGALSVEKVGGRFSIPSLEEVEKRYESLK